MADTDEKIIISEKVKINTEFTGEDISSLSIRPNITDGLTAKDLQERFDNLAKKAITAINDVIDAVNSADIADKIPITELADIDTLAALVKAITNGVLYTKISVNNRNDLLSALIEDIKLTAYAAINSISSKPVYNANTGLPEKVTIEFTTAADPDNTGEISIPIVDVFNGDISNGATAGQIPSYGSNSSLKANTPTGDTASSFDLINRAFMAEIISTLRREFEDNIAKVASSAYNYRGSVETYASLPTSAENGDVYNVETSFSMFGKEYPAGTNVVWGNSGWEILTISIDISRFVPKLKLSDGIWHVYAENGEGVDVGLTLTDGAVAGSVPKRDAEGNFNVTESDNNNRCATVGQVNKKLDAVTNSGTVPRVYVTNPDGTQSTIEITNIPERDTVAQRDLNGNFQVNAPRLKWDCVNLEYFNNSVGDIISVLEQLHSGITVS